MWMVFLKALVKVRSRNVLLLSLSIDPTFHSAVVLGLRDSVMFPIFFLIMTCVMPFQIKGAPSLSILWKLLHETSLKRVFHRILVLTRTFWDSKEEETSRCVDQNIPPCRTQNCWDHDRDSLQFPIHNIRPNISTNDVPIGP